MNLLAQSFVLYADEQWLVVDKPYGLTTHGGDAGDVGVQEWLALHAGVKTYVCSRLDKGTTGVLIFARTPEASAWAEKIHTEESSQKTYYFLSDRDVSLSLGKRWICEKELDGKSARTEFFFEGPVARGVFRYKALIARGRMHQIRRHAMASGCSLLGDSEYGGSPFARIALHCAELKWPALSQAIRSELPLTFQSDAHCSGRTVLEASVALERRGFWPASISRAWRVVQRGELNDLDVSVDLYGNHALVWIYDTTTREQIAEVLSPLFESLDLRFGCQGIVFRRIEKNPHKKGLVQEMWMEGVPPAPFFEVAEHAWQAEVTLTQRQHVGLFLDHRDNRRRVELNASGKRVANLFSYTCAFGLAAVSGGAEVVVNVDAAASALNVGKKNFDLNQMTASRKGKFVEKDVRVWLEKQVEKRLRGEDAGWDIVVCDPPTFSSTQSGGVFHVAKEWQSLAENCARILKPDGVCFFSANCQNHERQSFESELRKFFSRVQRLRSPLDFPEVGGRVHAHFFECHLPKI
ncbi:MAG: hypothetical protein RIR26_2386 [Pseudomonadota bacterium]